MEPVEDDEPERDWLPVLVAVSEPVLVAVLEQVLVALFDAVPERLLEVVVVGVGMMRLAGRQGSATPLDAIVAGTKPTHRLSYPPQHLTPPATDNRHVW